MNDKLVFKLGTRGSPLALWQAERVKALLEKTRSDSEVEIVIIHTMGDKIQDRPMVQVGGKGIFTKEIEDALLDKSIDFAVHSFKDLPTVQPDGLEIVCIPERDSPFDALFSEDGSCLKELPENPVIATGSLRRRAQILLLRPDAEVVDIRGNVNTRLTKYRESNWNGLVMAAAGIHRMKWDHLIAGVLPVDEMLPAPAQGALAIEARSGDKDTRELLLTIHNEETAYGVNAERSFLARLEGGCQVPMAAYAVVTNGEISLRGLVSDLDGTTCIQETLSAPCSQAEELGVHLAERLIALGGDKIIDDLKLLNE